MGNKTSIALLAALALGLGTLAGCEQEGPAERAGEKVDEAVEEAGDAVEEAGDAIEETAEETEEELEEGSGY